MFDQEEGELNVVIGVLFGVIALVIALVVGVAGYKLGQRGAGDEPVAVAAPQGEVLVVEQFTEIEPVGDALVKVYFGLGEVAFPAGAAPALDSVTQALQANEGTVVLISGFHDESGSAEANAIVARDRGLSVKQALIAAGVPGERVLMRKPAVTLGGEDAVEARRVEIRVQ